MRFVWASIVLALFVGCSSNDPFCSEFVDATGRPAAYCPDPNDVPVCDGVGGPARYEVGSAGYVLVGGAPARCTLQGDVTCPDGTTAPAYCLRDPEL